MDIHPVFKPKKKEANSEYSFPKIALLILTLSLIVSLVAFYQYYRKSTNKQTNNSQIYKKEIDSLKLQIQILKEENNLNSKELVNERKKVAKLKKEVKERDSIIEYWLLEK
jgi:Na+/phosphate symporter